MTTTSIEPGSRRAISSRQSPRTRRISEVTEERLARASDRPGRVSMRPDQVEEDGEERRPREGREGLGLEARGDPDAEERRTHDRQQDEVEEVCPPLLVAGVPDAQDLLERAPRDGRAEEDGDHAP